MRGTLTLVGIGPGHDEHMTPAALNAIKEADDVIGYVTYVNLVRHHLAGKQVTRTGMTEEISRARMAIDSAIAGKKVVLISSGDSGIYGMAGLVFEVLKERGWKRGDAPEIKLVPGITAANSCASLVGAPLIHDTCRISLSDLLTPWPVIEKRLKNAAGGDFVTCLYNPASGRRQRQIVEAANIFKEHRPGTTPVALIKSAYRRQQDIVLSNLDHFLDFEIGMNTTVIIGSSQTFIYEGYMVTPRGHTNKYDLLEGYVLEGQFRGLSLNTEGKLDPAMDRTLKVTHIPGTYMRTTTEFIPEEVKTETFSPDSSAEAALAALNILGSFKKQVVEKKIEGSSSHLARLAGAVVMRSGGDYYLIGDLKQPCQFEDHGFYPPTETPGTVIQLDLIDDEPNLKFQMLIEGEGEMAAKDLHRKLSIERNNSISERLINLVTEQSPRVHQEGLELTDARWLSQMPAQVWNMVREEILRCSPKENK